MGLTPVKTVLALATCYNRKEKTVPAVKSLTEGNPGIAFDFLILDDNSSDGTAEALAAFDNVTVIHGDGNCFYTGGMRILIDAAKKQGKTYDYCLLFNDDVRFYDHCIEYLASKRNDAVWVGPTCDEQGKLVYSGIVRRSRWKPKYRHLLAQDEQGLPCETLNGNCVLIPWKIFLAADNMPACYTHSFGDYDYGFSLTRKGFPIMVPDQFIGMCKNDTKIENSWQDRSLPLKERLRKKESVKGLPFKEYFHYLNRNFNPVTAVVYSLSPYIKMIAGK